MALEENPNIVTQVGERLDDLFGDTDVSEMTLNEKNEPKESPLRDLKAVILSIDWEITDKMMNRLIEQIGRLRKVYQKDRIILLFLQLLQAIGKYIQTYKVKAHPDAVKLLNAVYVSLEKVIQNKDMAQGERKRILSAQIARFQKLKERVKARKADSEKHKAMKPVRRAAQRTEKETPSAVQAEQAALEAAKPVSGTSKVPETGVQTSEAMALMLEEIRRCIRSEFQVLREELSKLM